MNKQLAFIQECTRLGCSANDLRWLSSLFQIYGKDSKSDKDEFFKQIKDLLKYRQLESQEIITNLLKTIERD